MAEVIKEDEYVKEILGFDIRVLTNKDEEATIRYFDFKGLSGAELTHDRDDIFSQKIIRVEITCLGYSMEIIKEE